MKTKSRSYSYERRNAKAGWLFILPILIGLVFVFFPALLDSLEFSIGKITLGSNGYVVENVGAENYQEILLNSPTFLKKLFGSVGSILVDIPVIVMFSLFIAVLLSNLGRGRNVFRAIFFMPVILATGIIAKAEAGNLMFSSMSSAGGADIGTLSSLSQGINFELLFYNLGLNPEIGSFIYDLVNNIYDVIVSSGIQILIFMSALQSIPEGVREAALVEGATAWEYFWKISFPLVTPFIAVNAFYTLIELLTKSTNPMMALISDTAFKTGQFGMAAAMSWVYCAVIVVIGLLLVWLIRQINRSDAAGGR